MNREPAYADVVAGLLDATPATATERFDAELADAVAAGLDPGVARALRWCQRESVRAVREHAAVVLPPVIAALVASEAAQSGPAAEPLAIAIATAPAQADPPVSPEDSRRRTLVAGLLSLTDSATA